MEFMARASRRWNEKTSDVNLFLIKTNSNGTASDVFHLFSVIN